MVTLLYHSEAVGWVCRNIAHTNPNIRVLCDRQIADGTYLEGRVIHWDSRKYIFADDVINYPECVRLSRNKRESRLVLGDIAPPTWVQTRDIEYPCVIRPKRHYGGVQLYVCNNEDEAREAIIECQDWYASALINKTHEYRVFVFRGEVIKVTRRMPPANGNVAWNPSQGADVIRVMRESWDPSITNIAVNAGYKLGLGWYAADVIKDVDRSYVLELNTAPGMHRQRTWRKFGRVFCER